MSLNEFKQWKTQINWKRNSMTNYQATYINRTRLELKRGYFL